MCAGRPFDSGPGHKTGKGDLFLNHRNSVFLGTLLSPAPRFPLSFHTRKTRKPVKIKELAMGSAQSSITPEAALITAAVVVGGAVAIGYSALGAGSSSSSTSTSSADAEAKAAKKKSKRKSTAAPGAGVETIPELDAAAPTSKSKKSKAKSKASIADSLPTTSASPLQAKASVSSLPGSFEPDAEPVPAVRAHSKKSKNKKGAKSATASLEVDTPMPTPRPSIPAAALVPAALVPAPPPAAAPVLSPIATPAPAPSSAKSKKPKSKKKSTPASASASTAAAAGESTDDGWTRVGGDSTSASAPSLTEDSLPEADEDEEEAEEIPLPGMRAKNVSVRDKPPKRPLAERLLPKPRKTGVDE
ncbi:hypothetical protein C8R45DRAFT_946350 [Mycena sanguinolenta]|nr:hypothetical protein C8R45DRAFT_946350 [Mycena sanguinolenta]